MFKRSRPKLWQNLGEDHLHDEKIMNAIEKSMLNNIHKHIDQGNRRFFKTAVFRYAAAAALLVFASLGLLFISKRNADTKLVSITALKGRISIISLPDGSKIWLNSGSTISYPEKFAKVREVRLINGEAFFDIRHDDHHPFIVRYGNMHVQVLGTAFNIKYYTKLKDVRVTVVRGLVEVGDQDRSFGMITPNKEIIYDQKEDTHNARDINSEKVAAWKAREVNLYDVPFEDLMLNLENIYGITVSYDHEAMKDVVTTIHFLSTDDLKQVLEIIKTIHGLNYTVEGKEVSLQKP
ncbi:FecR family protein [Mucilaginibacter sp. AW1-3]